LRHEHADDTNPGDPGGRHRGNDSAAQGKGTVAPLDATVDRIRYLHVMPLR
jgi:hypothetical protein